MKNPLAASLHDPGTPGDSTSRSPDRPLACATAIYSATTCLVIVSLFWFHQSGLPHTVSPLLRVTGRISIEDGNSPISQKPLSFFFDECVIIASNNDLARPIFHRVNIKIGRRNGRLFIKRDNWFEEFMPDMLNVAGARFKKPRVPGLDVFATSVLLLSFKGDRKGRIAMKECTHFVKRTGIKRVTIAGKNLTYCFVIAGGRRLSDPSCAS